MTSLCGKRKLSSDCSSGLVEVLSGPYNVIVTQKRFRQVGAQYMVRIKLGKFDGLYLEYGLP